MVTFSVGERVEVDDSITVTATDPSGITQIGWLATDANTGVTVGGDSTNFDGTLTQVSRTYNLNFAFTEFPQLVAITAFGVDAAGNRGEAQDTTGSASAASFLISAMTNLKAEQNDQGIDRVANGIPDALAWTRRRDGNP